MPGVTMNYELHLGDCLEVLRGLPANSIDSVVTDPPYGIRFRGKSWAVRTSKTAPRTG
ncbi:putative site-specific DNA methyltransferase [Pseudomonas syringae pv. maculicola]|uniref:Putative site-specific DNA methyltransferase n=2 Tax=Pseudomonas syringae group genomosp. 3 TaxID=251701 RepID=A0A3M6C764_PSEYM|nr:putative site-specific DNA methyltransferase [Pseudomonas syringae pv. maculicola]